MKLCNRTLFLGLSTVLIIKAFWIKRETYRQTPEEEVRF